MFVSEGGKTGITAIVTGLMFFVSVFFTPIFASFPPWATGGALVIVGLLMIKEWVFSQSAGTAFSSISDLIFSVREINWNYIGDAVPAFLTIIITAFSFKLSLYTSYQSIHDG